jgi:hypothetical protein
MTASPILAVQYLESPYPDATITEVRRRLHNAFERLPISLVLLGWELPIHIEEAVAVESALHNAKLFRWQPLLTGDAHTDLPPEWATIGPNSNSIPGHGGLPEFSFICPNRIAVADFISERVESVAASGLYQGLFLDRIRYPAHVWLLIMAWTWNPFATTLIPAPWKSLFEACSESQPKSVSHLSLF